MNKQQYEVHLVPTDKAPVGTLLLVGDGWGTKPENYKEIVINQNPTFDEEAAKWGKVGGTRWKPVHLYFTSDEQGKDGDWVLAWGGDEVDGELPAYPPKLLPFSSDIHGYRKIVATTNKELWDKEVRGQEYLGGGQYARTFNIIKGVAKIDTQYIEEYIKLYNEGKAPTKVWLEQSCLEIKGTLGSDYLCDLKLKPDGSVIVVKEEEKLYTRSEVKEVMNALFWYLRREVPGNIVNPGKINQWFDKNYPL